MTVSTTDSVVEYVSGGPAFPIPYRFLQDSDIEAVLVKQDGSSETLTGAQYTLTGAGAQSGGTLTSAYAAGFLATPGASLTISRDMDAVQPTDLRNQGKFLAETHETVFDRLTMLVQQGFAGISRALKRPVGKSYFDAEGRLISNVADPISDQDAATKGWAGRYFGDLIDGATGLINTTTGILYDAGTLFDYLRFGVNRSVDSIAALRLLSSARNQRAFAHGYYQKGDGGGGAYYVDQADTTSADNGGSIIVAADGARWKLSRLGRVSVLQFGAKLDSAFDSASAIANAHNALDSVYYPSGKVYCGQKLTFNKAFGMKGDGVNKSFIVFNGSTKGIEVIQQTADQGIDVEGIGFRTTAASASPTNVGLKINGTPQLGGSDGSGHLILNQRTQNRVTIRNVDFRGETDSAGWGVNLHFLSVMNFSTYNVTWRGSIPSVVGDLQGVGILVNGDGVPVDFSIKRTWGYYTQYSILAPDYLEGGHISDYEFVACTFGIIGRYTAGYSVLPQAATGCLSMYIGEGHLNVLQAGIILAKTNQSHIRDQNIYLQPRASDAPAVGIQLSDGNWNDIDSIFVSGDSALNTKANNLSVVLTNMGLSTVSKVKASTLQSAITLQGSTGNRITQALAAFCTSVIAGDSGSTNNDLQGRGQSLTGSKFSVPLDNNIIMEEYAGFASRTLAAGATATITITLPAGMFTEAPRFATLTIDQSTIYYKVQYLRSSSSASQVQFLLAPASPASTIPAETIEVSVNAKGI